MPTVFMVAEKPMLAESIARILSDGRASKRKGFNGACNLHEYNGQFRGQNARFKMSSTCGHVMGLDFLGKYNNWDRVDPSELFQAQIEKKEANPKLKMNAFLSSEAKGSDYLVLWLDCDKEGENICFEVINAVQPSMRQSGGRFMDCVFRAHFSAITDRDIKAAMQQLGRPDLNQSLSVDARQELDLRVGCAFTRFQTKYFQGKYGDLDSTLISFGPCQTPTLGFCVRRHDDIQSFKPESYWLIQLKLSTGPVDDPIEMKPEWDRGRIFDREVAQMFLDRVKSEKECKVVDVSKKEGTKQRPLALNTVEMMRVASSGLGMSPQNAMQIAERLYTEGYISYPRTETTQYPANFDFKSALRQQQNNPSWGSIVAELVKNGYTKPRNGDDKGDHPPITPMKPDEGRLSGDHKRLYDFITQNFIGSLMENCRFWINTIKTEIAGETFSISGKTLIDPGYTAVVTWQALAADSTMPSLSRGQTLRIDEAKLVERQTGPPDYLTEAELITLMEKHGIGTDASIPVHINNIGQRNYVEVTSGRKLIPTKLGISLVHGYWKIDGELVLPTMRAELETQLNLIAHGEADYERVKNHALENFRQKFMYFVQNITGMDLLFEVSFTSLAESGKPFSRCGKCRRYMKLVSARPQRLHCANCQDTYTLPNVKDGVLKLYSEQKCPLDDFELVYWQGPGGKLSKSYHLCPYCYSNPPFPQMKRSQGCNECTHPACRHAFSSLGVVRCPQQCMGGYGVLVLDTQSGPKWRLACNKCPAVVGLCDGAHKVKVKDHSCSECGAQMIYVEYKEGKSPLPDSLLEYTGCCFCDQILKPLVSLKHADRTVVFVPNQSRGGFRGRGGNRGASRGRGRGRGSRGRR